MFHRPSEIRQHKRNHAPFESTYLPNAKLEIKAVIDEIEARVPWHFTGAAPETPPRSPRSMR